MFTDIQTNKLLWRNRVHRYQDQRVTSLEQYTEWISVARRGSKISSIGCVFGVFFQQRNEISTNVNLDCMNTTSYLQITELIYHDFQRWIPKMILYKKDPLKSKQSCVHSACCLSSTIRVTSLKSKKIKISDKISWNIWNMNFSNKRGGEINSTLP